PTCAALSPYTTLFRSGRPVEHPSRCIGRLLFRLVEKAEVLTDDFIRGMAGELFSAAVPAAHDAINTQCKNGIAGNTIHEASDTFRLSGFTRLGTGNY